MTFATVRTHWAGTTGGAGLTQTNFVDAGGAVITNAQAGAAVNAVRAFWDAIKAYLPNEVNLTVSPVVDIYDIQTGDLTASTTWASAPAVVTGTGVDNYSMAAGLKVNANTADIRNGRRVRGAIYIVPANSSAFSNSGLAAAGAKSAINTAGANLNTALLAAGCNPIVWSRPIPADKPNGPRNGEKSVVSTFEVNDKTAVLRGRRD